MTFSGKSGRSLLLGLLLRAKFARPLERHAVLSRWLADLTKQLSAGRPVPVSGDTRWEHALQSEMADCILTDARSGQLPWWTMTEGERLAFVCEVAFAPHSISTFDAEEIVLMVQDHVQRAEDLVKAVAKATGK